MNDQVSGPLRAMVPTLVAYMVARGYLPEALQGAAGDAIIAVVGFAAAAWSWWSNRPTAHVKAVAAMAGTIVSSSGNTITVVDSNLASVARENATDAAGK